jgi:hypothetical protein
VIVPYWHAYFLIAFMHILIGVMGKFSYQDRIGAGFGFASVVCFSSRRFIVVESIASGGLAMSVSAWIIVPGFWGLLVMSSAAAGDMGLVYMYNRSGLSC